ncbi:MAG: TPM domain-containing protein, partial [Candidatus Limnocylindrales bacterium]
MHIVLDVRRRIAIVVALVGALALAAPGVRAEEVLRLDGPVTDPGGVLDGRSTDVAGAIESTLDTHGVQVFVLFVGSTEDLSAGDYAAQTAETNSLGVDDALLLVAVDDRTDYIWVSDSLDEITDDELDAILVDTLEPSLRDGDFAGGAIAAVEALG